MNLVTESLHTIQLYLNLETWKVSAHLEKGGSLFANPQLLERSLVNHGQWEAGSLARFGGGDLLFIISFSPFQPGINSSPTHPLVVIVQDYLVTIWSQAGIFGAPLRLDEGRLFCLLDRVRRGTI